MYNTPAHHSNGPVERVSIAMPDIEPEPTFFRSYGIYAIISILLFGLSALFAVSSIYSSYSPFFWADMLLWSPFLPIVSLAAAFSIVPAFLFWRQRARRRLYEAFAVETTEPDRDSFFY